MALQNFVDQKGPAVSAAFLNGIDQMVNGLLQGSTTIGELQSILGIASPIAFPIDIDAGGTGASTLAGAQAALGITPVTQAAIGALIYPEVSSETGMTIANFTVPYAYPARYGAVGDGSTDDYPAFNNAVTVARALGISVMVPPPATAYRLGTQLVLASATLTPVNLVGTSAQWFNQGTCVIQGNFSGPLIETSGTTSVYSTAPYIANVTLFNQSTNAAACCVHGANSGGLRMHNVYTRCQNWGVYSEGNMISAKFHEVVMDTGNASSSVYGAAGYKVAGNNCSIIGGRTYQQTIAIDFSGQSWLTVGHNSEFCQVYQRAGAYSSCANILPHVEGAHCVITNATSVPVNYSGAWTDNGSQGIGGTGEIAFYGGVFNGVATNSNFAVIKSQAGFVFGLRFQGIAPTGNNLIVGNSFTPGTSIALPSGTRINSLGSPSLLINPPPADQYSFYNIDNGVVRQISALQSPQISLGTATSGSIANGGNISINTGITVGQNVWDVSFHSTSSGYDFVQTFRAVQSQNTVVFGTPVNVSGAGSGTASQYTVTWNAGAFIINNASGATRTISMVVNNVYSALT